MKCPECSFVNLAELARCQQCGWRLAAVPREAKGGASARAHDSILVLDVKPSPAAPKNATSQSTSAPTNGGNGEEEVIEVVEPEVKAYAESDPTTGAIVWREEVTRRVRAYRVRRRRIIEGQEDLPFAKGEQSPGPAAPPPQASVAPPRPRRREPERIELPLIQPTLAFEGAESQPAPTVARAADVAQRARAGLLDLAVVLTSYAAFFALFVGLGREIPLGKLGLLIYGLIFVFLFTGYLFLSTAFAGRTLGMRLMGLEVVRFDGAPPSVEDALWRTLGYLISAGAFCLGFIWVFVDDRQLTWHDRISKTFLVTERKPAEEAA